MTLDIRQTEAFWKARTAQISDDDGALELARALREISVEIGRAIAKAGGSLYARPRVDASSLAVYAGTLKAAADALERIPVAPEE
jgi:hypothetical protein